jgi:hypothetical protein
MLLGEVGGEKVMKKQLYNYSYYISATVPNSYGAICKIFLRLAKLPKGELHTSRFWSKGIHTRVYSKSGRGRWGFTISAIVILLSCFLKDPSTSVYIILNS